MGPGVFEHWPALALPEGFILQKKFEICVYLLMKSSIMHSIWVALSVARKAKKNTLATKSICGGMKF